MKQTSRGLAPSLNTGHSTFTGARQRLAVALVAIVMAFAGAQTARAQEEEILCNVTFDISGGGTVELGGETVTNGQTIDCSIPYGRDLIITPETGYYVSSVTYDATGGLRIDLNQDVDFHWSLNIRPYEGPEPHEGSEPPTITVHIVFDEGLAGGADEASAVALTADDDLSHLAGGWYKVESDLTLGHTVNLHGDTHITIATGKTLTVNTSDEYGISGSALTVSGEGTLAVSASNIAINVYNYTQTGCAVTLSGNNFGLHAKNNVSISGGSLTTSGADYGIDTNNGSITISGGTVSSSGDQCGLFAARAMNITGGTVSASGNVGNGIRGYSVSITGGQVTASSGGIYSAYGDITLGWTSATDYITASGFTVEEGQHVKIADGQKLYGGGFPSASYTGTVDDPSALNGLMLRPTAAVTESGTNEYTIWNADGWDAFCDRLAADDGKAFFSGKTVKLADDIIVTRMAGSQYHDFCGTFDGGGKTLTVNYTNNNNNVMTAPFSYVDGATIRNLIVDGSITGSAYRAAGVIGETGTNKSYITNCVSSLTISSGRYTAGFSIGGNVEIEGCVFNGKINGTDRSGGFIGYSNSAQVIKNSLFAPQDGSSINGGTFYYNGDGDVAPVNSYYTRTLGNAQGKALHTVTAGTDVTISAIALTGDATQYTVSGITAYSGGGLQLGENLYYGSGDQLSLTLSNAPTGYQYDGYQYGFTASAGTLSGSTLTMPAADVTVSFGLRSTGVAVEVSYLDADGTARTAQAIALDGTETDLAAGWYFVGLPTVAFDHMLDLNGNVHLILADGCTMNVTSSDGKGIYVDGSLTIYGQTDGTGTLNATGLYGGIYTGSGNITISGGTVIANSDNGDGITTNSGTITISGGTVIANSDNGDGISTYSGTITISGGRVTVTGENEGIHSYSGTITISGGRVTVTGGYEGIYSESGNITISGGRVTVTGGRGIITNSGTITLGCTTASDFIYASSYFVGPGGTLKIADGQTLFNEDGISYSGTLNIYGIPDGKTLRLSPGIALTARQAPDGNYWTTYYNGALGFTIDADENACAYTATYSAGQLTLHNLGKEIPAGTAVIIVADNDEVSMATATDLDDFSDTNDLRGVDDDTPVADIRSDLGEGTLYVLGMTTVNNEQHFGFHRYTGSMMAAHKAFVHVGGSPSQAAARSLTMVFDDATGISDATRLNNKEEIKNNNWFTLDGRRLQAKPTAPGIYVNNGSKVVIK